MSADRVAVPWHRGKRGDWTKGLWSPEKSPGLDRRQVLGSGACEFGAFFFHGDDETPAVVGGSLVSGRTESRGVKRRGRDGSLSAICAAGAALGRRPVPGAAH